MNWLTPENLVNAISLGALYALIAVGYTMVYGIVKLINFAHGEIFMLGAYWALLVVGMNSSNPTGFGLLWSFVPAMALCAFVGLTVDWSAYLSLRRRLPLADWGSVGLLVLLSIGAIFYMLTGNTTSDLHSETMHTVLLYGVVILIPVAMLGLAVSEKFGALGASRGAVTADRLNALITAIGMSLVLQTLVQLIFGAEYRAFPRSSLPEFFSADVFPLFGAQVKGTEFTIWVVAILMMIGLQLLVSRTRIGTAMRACSQDKEAAALMGISVDRVIAFTFLVGSAMAAVAGILYAAKVGGNIFYRMGYYPGLLAFAAAVLGGIGNIRGALLGGMLIGGAEAFGGGFELPFTLMVVILLVRPRGILGKPDSTRA